MMQLFLLSLLTFVSFSFAAPAFADGNLLANPGFEDGVNQWTSTPSTATLAPADSVKVGTRSALLTKTQSSSYAYFYQRVPVEKTKQYTLSGYVTLNDPNIESIKLRLFLLDEQNNKIASAEAETKGKSNEWQYLETPALADNKAVQAEAQGYVILNTKNPTSPALFDELALTETIASPSATPTPTPLDTPVLSPTNAISYTNIFISEVMPAPSPGNNEWVELYNGNAFDVTLQNWFIDDIANGGSSPKQFNLSIPAQGYASVDLTSAIFNNDGDSVRLLDFNSALKDSIEYSSTTTDKTIGRISFTSDTTCAQEPSKNATNTTCVVTTTATPTPSLTPTPPRTPTPPPTPTITTHPTQAIHANYFLPTSFSATTSALTKKLLPTPTLPAKEMVLGATSNKRNDSANLSRIVGITCVILSLLSITAIAIRIRLKATNSTLFSRSEKTS